METAAQSTDNYAMSPTAAWSRYCPAMGLIAALSVCAAAGAQAVEVPEDSGDLSLLRRQVCHFDFEESERTPLEMPLYFHRHLDAPGGYPPFGRMRPSSEAAADGNWSFLFELGGGSMSAAVPTGILPVVPLADYLVAVKVRTEGLAHSAVRVVARLHDPDGQPIAGSESASELVRTDGQWQTISTEVRGVFPEAVDLVVELQLLQPDALEEVPRATGEPTIQDIAGRAWFDDVQVWHLPRIELTTDAPGNVFVAPRQPRLNLRVRDLINTPLTARLQVFDLNGRCAVDQSFPAPRGRDPRPVEVPLERFGWFRAVLDVNSPNELISRQWVDFAVVPPAPDGTGHSGFGVVLPVLSDRDLEIAPELCHRLNADTVLFPVWDSAYQSAASPAHHKTLKRAVEQMLANDQELIFALHNAPEDVAASMGLQPSQVLDLIGSDPESWRPLLADLLLEFGLEVRRWQIGPTGDSTAIHHPHLAAALEDAAGALGEFIPHPVLILPHDTEQEVDPNLALPGLNVTIPYHVRPEAIPGYAPSLLDEGGELTVTLEALPYESYSPRQRALDLLLRGLYAWRAGLPETAVSAPWRCEEDRICPEPTYGVWRGLADNLRDRKFAGELDLADGVECWIVEGPDAADAALIAWSRQRGDEPSATLSLLLGDHEIEAVDPFGNRRAIPKENGVHRLTLSEMPLFINHVNLPLARFRAGLAIEPDFVPAIHKVHEHSIILHNPWDVTISGTIRIHSVGALHVTPRIGDFIIPPDQRISLPIEVITDRSIIAGRKRVEATVQVNADRAYELRLHTNIEVGLEDIESVAAYHVVPNPRTGTPDLSISQFVTNTGSRRLNLSVSLLAPGVSQRRRDIAALDPGQTAVRTFRIERGVELLSGRSVRLGVSERDGIARLNQLLEIPDLMAPRQAAATADE